MKEKGALIGNPAGATVASNRGVEKALNREGIRMERTPVGDKYVSARMQEGGYSIGGEESGHIIFSKYSTTGDGILTAIRVMEILVEKKTLPSFLTAGVQLFPKVQINKRVKDASAVLEREAGGKTGGGGARGNRTGADPKERNGACDPSDRGGGRGGKMPQACGADRFGNGRIEDTGRGVYQGE